MGKINEYELENKLVLFVQSPYAFESADPSTPIKEVPPADTSSMTEYSINKGMGVPETLVKRPGFTPR